MRAVRLAIEDLADERARRRADDHAGDRARGTGRGADHGQPVRDRFGERHSVALEPGRQNEDVGGLVQSRETIVRDCAGDLHAIRETESRDVRKDPRRRLGVSTFFSQSEVLR